MDAFSLAPRPLPAVDDSVVEPELPLIDAHHHLWSNVPGDSHHMMDFLVSDVAELAAGHNVVGTVYQAAGVRSLTEGPVELRGVGETTFARAQGEETDTGRYGAFRICNGIVGTADMMLGPALGDVLDAHIDAGGGRFKGIRAYFAYHGDPDLPDIVNYGIPERMNDPLHRAGAVELQKRGLVLDWMVLQHQLRDSLDYFDAFPDLPIVLNHIGGRVAIGRFSGPASYQQWTDDMAEVAKRPNVTLKLGGFGMWHVTQPEPRDDMTMSQVLTEAWQPLFDPCVEAFGPERCMFESNFPVDAVAGSYRQFWNAYKMLCTNYSPDERSALLHDTAARVYSLDV